MDKRLGRNYEYGDGDLLGHIPFSGVVLAFWICRGGLPHHRCVSRLRVDVEK